MLWNFQFTASDEADPDRSSKKSNCSLFQFTASDEADLICGPAKLEEKSFNSQPQMRLTKGGVVIWLGFSLFQFTASDEADPK
mgnify:CR=1 FL=1